MVSNSEYSGSRLISYEFGLVADFPIGLPYSVPYYLRLVFSRASSDTRLGKKGDRTMTDIWAAKNQSFEYLERLEEDTGEEMELDVISLCCDYSELTFQEVAKEYSLTLEETEDEGEEVTYNWETMNDDQLEEVVKEYLEENTCVVGFTDTTVVYLNF